MRKRYLVGTALFSSLLIQACSPEHVDDNSNNSLISAATHSALERTTASRVADSDLNPDDAARMASEDFAKGQCNLYAIRNWSYSIPGKDAPALVKPSSPTSDDVIYVVVYIQGMSDMASPNAEKFATTYNEIALKNCEAKK
ncbi:MAG: hypothetical protein NVV72_11055 [Asticcacaulis sp.]|nr:hypothetical protein [Asticcacaulis sp.]